MFQFIADTAAQTVSNAPVAGEASGKAASGGGFMGLLPIIIIFAVMIFFMSRSQKKQQRKREEMLSQIARGAKVLLASGIYGTVSEVKGDVFVIEIAEGVKVRVSRTGIAGLEETTPAGTVDPKNPDGGSKK